MAQVRRPGQARRLAHGRRQAPCVDLLRRNKLLAHKHEEIWRALNSEQADAISQIDAALDDDVGDDLLRLVFTACHPVLSTEARVALTLRLLCGLTTEEIARAFLVTESTVAQRIVRAKRTLAEKQVPFEVPRGAELAGRLSSVLEVIYLFFNEGYSATAGDEWIRPALCEEALRLGRIVAELMPNEPEVHGLVSLMEIQSSRLRARVGPAGEPIVLLEQNRALLGSPVHSARPAPRSSVPSSLAAHAVLMCFRRRSLPVMPGRERRQRRIGPVLRRSTRLSLRSAPSPIVELNRAVAMAMAFGPVVGLELVDALTMEPSLQEYHLLPAVRGDLLAKLGRLAEARVEFERAAGLTRNVRERELLLERAKGCGGS